MQQSLMYPGMVAAGVPSAQMAMRGAQGIVNPLWGFGAYPHMFFPVSAFVYPLVPSDAGLLAVSLAVPVLLCSLCPFPGAHTRGSPHGSIAPAQPRCSLCIPCLAHSHASSAGPGAPGLDALVISRPVRVPVGSCVSVCLISRIKLMRVCVPDQPHQAHACLCA